MFAATNCHYRRVPDESYSPQKRLGWLYPSDRMGMRFSVVHESLDGTKLPNREVRPNRRDRG